MFKQKSGAALIQSSITNFTKVVTELETGIARCAQEEETANATIEALNKELSVIQAAKARATLVKENIEKMLGL